MCLTKVVGESMVGYWSLFLLVGGYIKDNLRGSMINFQDFNLQSSIQACLVFTPLILTVSFLPHLIISGVILETEGSIWKIQKRTLFHYSKVKKGTPNLTSPYVHSLFTIVLKKQIFEKISHRGQRPEVELSFSLK